MEVKRIIFKSELYWEYGNISLDEPHALVKNHHTIKKNR